MTVKLGIVIGAFYQDYTRKIEQLIDAFSKQHTNVETRIIKVPGAVEIPIVAKLLALQEPMDAVVLFGVVVRGDTSHYDYVCQQVSFGCQAVALETLKPIVFGVLTCENDQQVLDRLGGRVGNKVEEALSTALTMVPLCASLKQSLKNA